MATSPLQAAAAAAQAAALEAAERSRLAAEEAAKARTSADAALTKAREAAEAAERERAREVELRELEPLTDEPPARVRRLRSFNRAGWPVDLLEVQCAQPGCGVSQQVELVKTRLPHMRPGAYEPGQWEEWELEEAREWKQLGRYKCALHAGL